MTSATLNLRVQQKRMMTAQEAAYYCGFQGGKSPVKRFQVECPCPTRLVDSQELYDIKQLDKWIDSFGSSDSNVVPYDKIVEQLACRSSG